MGKVIMSGRVPKLVAPVVLPDVGTTLNDCTWAQIRAISDAGLAASYFAVGDRKAVDLNGTVGTAAVSATYYVYIIGFDHNADVEGSGITFGTFKTAASDGVDICLVDDNNGNQSNDGTKYFSMNHSSGTNVGGWESCDLRKDILGSDSDPINPTADTLMSALPAELRAVMRPMMIYTDNIAGGTNVVENITATTDYLPLLSEFEIYASALRANKYEQNYQKQYDYYVAGNSKQKYKSTRTVTPSGWWHRSPYYGGSTQFSASSATSGNLSSYTANGSYGIAPIFRV